MSAAARGWHSWLTSDAPASRRQARLGETYRLGRAFLRHPLAVAGLVIVLLLALAAGVAPLVAPFSPTAQHLGSRLQSPGAGHWLGTDEFGRDIFSRLIFGARITLGIVTLVAAITAPVGLVVGCAAGYLGGAVDAVLMRLILALAFVAALGAGIENAVLAIALVAWPPYARIARAETLALCGTDFVAAARLAGASSARIVLRHIMPLCLASVIVRVSLDMAGVILIAAGLGFLGLGAQPPSPEWGAMIAAGRSYMLGQWWVAAMPGIAIAAVSLGFNLLGDGLRDVLDPKQR
jgi:peptide/nickel transport system permease protein